MPIFKINQIPRRYRPGFLRELDKRTDIYLRLAANYERLINDLGGDYSAISHAKLALVERFIWLEELIRILEMRSLHKPDDAAELSSRIIQASNSLQGIARQIGLEKAVAPRSALKTLIGQR
jgi:hypothetical protein